MKIDSVTDTLSSQGGFRLVPKPLHIANLDFGFEFDAVLEGPDGQHGLVLVSDGSTISTRSLERLIQSFSLALSRTDSLRTLTLVLINSDAGQSDLASLETLCRVINVRDAQSLTFDLRGLLPLAIPPPSNPLLSSAEVLASELASETIDELTHQLIKAAKDSAQSVAAAALAAVERAATIAKVPS